MKPEAAKRLRLLASIVSVLLLVAAAATIWYYTRLRASLPQLDGQATVAGLGAPVKIERDALGVPTIRGQSRADVARATGWLHAQDRFFQMDAMRRNAAGELAELVGKRALALDRARRMHGFRKLAQNVVAALPAADRAVLDAYVTGVNAGLTALESPPAEYHLLRTEPQPWRAEDSMLVAYAMTIDLQDETGAYEKTLMTLRDQFGATGVAFFAPLVGPDDSALDGSTAPLPPIPGPNVVDVRTQRVGTARLDRAKGPNSHSGERLLPAPFSQPRRDAETFPGSNAFALAGTNTASGAALLANDMHLDHGIPNTWYRAVFEWTNDGEPRRVAGVTLPGIPLMVAGSNGHVAWGFTASYADVSDLVVIETSPGLDTYYNTPGGESVPFELREEKIAVKGDEPVTMTYRWTRWGPVVGETEKGRPLALRWVAHDAAATNLGLMAMETARDVPSALRIAHRAGMPAQNIVVADRAGATAWTIAGALPKRIGYDGRLPTTWTYGDRRWEGLLPPGEIPVVRNDRIWSANQRHVGGDDLGKIGDGGYARGHRGGMIRERLASLERAAPRDLLAVQLDDRATFLEPWHRLLMETLSPEAMKAKGPRAALRSYAEKWDGHASVRSISYPIVKQFRQEVRARVFPAIFASCREANPQFDWQLLSLEPALWALLREKPLHLLDPRFASWEELLVTAVDDVIGFLDQQAITMPNATWGRRNTVHLRHPFSYSMPTWMTGWLDFEPTELPGDTDMPRVQRPHHGASERFVVSPGREEEGIFHMPCGQSGHPLSPFYRAGHDAWVRGEPTPFLPGQTAHTLTLVP